RPGRPDGGVMVARLLDRQRLLDAFMLLATKLARRGVVDLPRSWLNNQASRYVSGRAGRGTPAFDRPNLRVLTTPAQHLLAMKFRAARSTRDADDIGLLQTSADRGANELLDPRLDGIGPPGDGERHRPHVPIVQR